MSVELQLQLPDCKPLGIDLCISWALTAFNLSDRGVVRPDANDRTLSKHHATLKKTTLDCTVIGASLSDELTTDLLVSVSGRVSSEASGKMSGEIRVPQSH